MKPLNEYGASEEPQNDVEETETANGTEANKKEAKSEALEKGPPEEAPVAAATTSGNSTAIATASEEGAPEAAGVSIVSQSDHEEEDQEQTLQTSAMDSTRESPVRASPAVRASSIIDVDEHAQELAVQLDEHVQELAVQLEQTTPAPTLIEPEPTSHQPQDKQEHVQVDVGLLNEDQEATGLTRTNSSRSSIIDVDELSVQRALSRQNSDISLGGIDDALADTDTHTSPPPPPPPAQIQPQPPRASLRSKTKPTFKSITEENSQTMDNSNAHFSFSTESAHSRGNLPDEKIQQIRNSMTQTNKHDSERSVASMPVVPRNSNASAQKQIPRASTTGATEPPTKTTRKSGRGLFGSTRRSSSARSLMSATSTRSSSLWKGIKNRISLVGSVTKSRRNSKRPSNISIGAASAESANSVAHSSLASERSSNRRTTSKSPTRTTRRGRLADRAIVPPNATHTTANPAIPKTQTTATATANPAIRRAHTSPVRTPAARALRLMDDSAQSAATEGGRTRQTPPSRKNGKSMSPVRVRASTGTALYRYSQQQQQELTHTELEKLEHVARALKEGLPYTTVTDRLKQKTYHRCFNGRAAVDFLSNYTDKPRQEALHVGRQIVRQFGLFVNTTGFKFSISHNSTQTSTSTQQDSFLLQDSSTTYYRMVAYLPMEVARMNMTTKTRLFEEGVSVKTRQQGLRKYSKCFVGAKAVSFLVGSRIVKSRTEAVDLGRKFVSQYNLFEPVNRDADFMDSRTKLYRFVDKRKRYFAINNMLSTRLIQMGDNSDPTNDDGSSLGGNSTRSGSTKDSEEMKESSLLDGDDHISQEHQKLFEVADIMERGVKVCDNTNKAGGKKGVSYMDTFIAARAVTFMVTSGLADSRDEATVLGRKLERELNLFVEVSGKHDFGDTNHYFRFTEKKDRFMKPIRAEKPLNLVAEMFEQNVKVKDYTYRLRTYKKTFIGSRAVDFLVNSRLASNRANAVRLGCQLVAEYNLFDRVTGDREFCDDHCYYRFTPEEKRRNPELEALTQPKQRSGRGSFLRRSQASRASLVPKHVSAEMLRIAESVLKGVKVKEHKFRAKPYGQTFVGSETVSFLVNSSLAKSRKEAVDLGKKLSQEVGLFIGIDGQKDFKDDYLLYRFSEQFEEDLDSEHDDHVMSTRLRGLISGVSGSVNVKSLPLEKMAEAFRNGVKVGDHKEKTNTYKDTFLGSEAVDFLVGIGLSESRVDAVDLGRSLAREFSLFEHIHHDREFEDEEFLYKFCYEGEIRHLEAIEIDISRLMYIAKDFEQFVKTKVNKFRLRKFNNTFLGVEAVDYLVDSCVASSRKEAVQIGRAITKEFNLFEHVTNDRKFEDSNIPFFFVKNNERYKGLNLEKKRARRNIFQHSDDDESDGSSGSCEMDNTSLRDNSAGSMGYTYDTEDKEWANKMATFERRMNKSVQMNMSLSTMKMVTPEDDESSQSSSEVRMQAMQGRFHEWASKFHRLDPRYQIRYFFDFVAQDGAEDAETKVMEVDTLRALYKFLPSRAQVFTVWRPTSADAIRKMINGEAVGKGLDIKGKSAKRGKLSGFVPFLQIGENKHKSKIRPPSKEGVVRIFYPGSARRGRDLAAEKLERVALEMIETVEAAKKVLENNESSKSARKDALESMLLDMGPDPTIEYLDDYAPNRFGLEIPERLFWEAFFNQQDITRKAGSEYDTGRPSQPAFQDMNFAAIRAEPKEDAPRAVVYQGADPDSPMNPFELLVAYEENGRVMPVVSDFDCFLVGTKRVKFESPLPPEQLDVLKWYIKNLEGVMKSSKVGDSWTVNWLEVLKKAAREGFYPEMPRFGFGDPKSYSIMKNAVSRLSHSGAVRHGAECFNYYFPQDLDDEFLVIANDLENNKSWAYVDVEGLQDILEQKIEEGYTFPLNPKWVLCDSFRWKELYDKLLLSDKEETQQSMRVWFPPDSGLREIIERVHESRPNGFYKSGPGAADDDDSDSDSGAGGGAGAKETMMSTVVALRLLEKFQQRTKNYQASLSSGGGSNADDSDDSD